MKVKDVVEALTSTSHGGGVGGYTLNPVDAYLESAPDFNP
jgi:hypothetical protein